MHESEQYGGHEIERSLKEEARRISAEHGNSPTIIIVGGSEEGPVRTMLASSFEGGRLRDLLGTLQVAQQIETLKHFRFGGPSKEAARKAQEEQEDTA